MTGTKIRPRAIELSPKRREMARGRKEVGDEMTWKRKRPELMNGQEGCRIQTDTKWTCVSHSIDRVPSIPYFGICNLYRK